MDAASAAFRALALTGGSSVLGFLEGVAAEGSTLVIFAMMMREEVIKKAPFLSGSRCGLSSRLVPPRRAPWDGVPVAVLYRTVKYIGSCFWGWGSTPTILTYIIVNTGRKFMYLLPTSVLQHIQHAKRRIIVDLSSTLDIILSCDIVTFTSLLSRRTSDPLDCSLRQQRLRSSKQVPRKGSS